MLSARPAAPDGENAQPSEPTRPIRSSARRSSGWKMTTSASKPTHGARLEDPGQESQVEQLGHGVDAVEHDRPDDQADRARPLDEAEQAVDQERRQRRCRAAPWARWRPLRPGRSAGPFRPDPLSASRHRQDARMSGCCHQITPTRRDGRKPWLHRLVHPRQRLDTLARLGSSSSDSSRVSSSSRSTPRSAQPRWK